MNMLAQWEDSENHRQIQFSIEYTIDNSDQSMIVVEGVTPTKVTFICPETNTVLRSVGVHTDKGRAMLRDQFVNSGQLDELVVELGKKNGLLAPAE